MQAKCLPSANRFAESPEAAPFLKSAKCRFESDWGHSRRPYSSAVAGWSLLARSLDLEQSGSQVELMW